MFLISWYLIIVIDGIGFSLFFLKVLIYVILLYKIKDNVI